MSFSPLDSLLTGPLFATAEMRAAFSDRAAISAMLGAEAALARAQAEQAIVPQQLAAALETIEADELDPVAIGEQTALAGVPTIPFLKMLEVRLPEELRPHLHHGATTQDIVDTALVLQIRNGLAALRPDLERTIAGLAKLAAEHRRTVMIGRTYGQHAAPVTFGYKAAVWCLGIAEPAGLLPGVASRILVASLGGPVGTLTALGDAGPAVAQAFARHLGLGAAPLAWHTRRARMVETGSWLAMVIGALAKMATDIVHLASTEVDEVAEPQMPGRGGSSAMPHKRNPVSSTTILAAHGAAAGPVATMIGAMAAAHERPAGAWHAEWHALPQLFGLASGALRSAAELAEGLVVHHARMRENLDRTRGLPFADKAAAWLSRSIGRDEAHRTVARAADAVRATGSTLAAALHADPSLPPDALAGLAAAFDPEAAIEAAALWTDHALQEVDRIRNAAAVQ